MRIRLAAYDLIVVNSSAGKDSQAMLDYLVQQCDLSGVSRSKLVVVHADLGRVEWEGTRELAEEQAQHYGVRFLAISRPQGDLLTQVRHRRRWPSPKQRYCTSDHKRAQVFKVINRLCRELGKRGRVRVLNCMGLRAAESPARSKLLPFRLDRRQTNGKKIVHAWLPIHAWTTEEVWARIKASGVRHHRAYDLGMPRLSCCFCIFSPKSALLLAAKHNPQLLDEYVKVEQEIGHRFRQELPIADIKKAVERGEEPGEIRNWQM
jgi:3'-phosphoadenosine 5'-phosphosulfate sulfotransferase (PAPS reductase)/FAD synthetase